MPHVQRRDDDLSKGGSQNDVVDGGHAHGEGLVVRGRRKPEARHLEFDLDVQQLLGTVGSEDRPVEPGPDPDLPARHPHVGLARQVDVAVARARNAPCSVRIGPSSRPLAAEGVRLVTRQRQLGAHGLSDPDVDALGLGGEREGAVGRRARPAVVDR